MDIDEIRTHRHQLESQLRDLIAAFEAQTHVAVTGIELQHIQQVGQNRPVLIDVAVKVNLDA